MPVERAQRCRPHVPSTRCRFPPLASPRRHHGRVVRMRDVKAESRHVHEAGLAVVVVANPECRCIDRRVCSEKASQNDTSQNETASQLCGAKTVGPPPLVRGKLGAKTRPGLAGSLQRCEPHVDLRAIEWRDCHVRIRRVRSSASVDRVDTCPQAPRQFSSQGGPDRVAVGARQAVDANAVAGPTDPARGFPTGAIRGVLDNEEPDRMAVRPWATAPVCPAVRLSHRAQLTQSLQNQHTQHPKPGELLNLPLIHLMAPDCSQLVDPQLEHAGPRSIITGWIAAQGAAIPMAAALCAR